MLFLFPVMLFAMCDFPISAMDGLIGVGFDDFDSVERLNAEQGMNELNFINYGGKNAGIRGIFLGELNSWKRILQQIGGIFRVPFFCGC